MKKYKCVDDGMGNFDGTVTRQELDENRHVWEDQLSETEGWTKEDYDEWWESLISENLEIVE